ncbi:MAG: hypothetical protein WD578_13810 [Bacteroidales bacterium]
MKNNFAIFLIALGAMTLITRSCDSGDENTDPIIDGIEIDSDISENTTWDSGNVYVLDGRIAVKNGVTLTIEPGVIVKARAGTGVNASALLVARGGKIMAEGTASTPIIFTTLVDEIEPGEVASPNLEPVLNGLWGGLIILGNAPISADAASVQIEGIPPSDINGLYGGDKSDDNSGILKYISIRHGGANIGEGNEINGLTLGGVGSETIIENIEIVANQDDGIEWFGGSVNVTNVVVWNTGDDAIDADQAWSGTLDNFIIINPGDECFELDGAEGIATARHTIRNGSVYAGNSEGLADLDNYGAGDPGNSFVEMKNIYFFGLKYGQTFDDNPAELTASMIEATLPSDTLSLSDFFLKGTDAYVKEVATNSVGADVSKFKDWSWAAVSGALDDFE